MNVTRTLMLALATGTFVTTGEVIADPMGTAFTYQGFLTDGGAPAQGEYDLLFRLCRDDACTDVVDTVAKENESVTDGLFTVVLDFGADAFTGEARWVELNARPGIANDPDPYETILPRQELTPTPHALALPGLWTQQNAASPNLIGGYHDNIVASGVIGAVIGGGGHVGSENRTLDDYTTIGGGVGNQAGSDDDDATTAPLATVGGGFHNIAGGDYATVGGGGANNAGADYATIAGGVLNWAGGDYSAVGGGTLNAASNTYATIGGGDSNIVSGEYATVPGGSFNTAGGAYSFAAGRRAKANHDGTFVWADSTDADFASTAANQFLIRATGGVGIGHNSPSDELDVRTSSKTRAIYGRNTKSTGDNVGIIGMADADGGDQTGVVGNAFLNTTSVYTAKGVIGYADADDSAGSSAVAMGGHFAGHADANAWGVYSYATTDTDTAKGVYASAHTDNSTGTSTYGIYAVVTGEAPTEYAGYFVGDVHVTDTFSKGGGSFKIDHPLDPENKYLYHSFVESPDMMNVYNGNVVLDESGQATVQMPEWFEALNRDFRYQLTCIGRFAPVYIAEEIHDNTFKIAGGKRGMRVSWQVTGIRQDAFANAHRIPVEENKPEKERGLYLHPEVHGMSKELGVDYEHEPQAELARMAAQREHAEHLPSEPQDIDGAGQEGGDR